MRGVVIGHSDALRVIRVQDSPDTLFFVDPPYVASTRDKGSKYRHEMTDEQHVELLTLLRGIKGRAMVSGYASALYDTTCSTIGSASSGGTTQPGTARWQGRRCCGFLPVAEIR